jgi:hypothetical protein
MTRFVWFSVVLVVAAACGKVVKSDAMDGSMGTDTGTDTGGGACTTNDQCSAPTPVCETTGGTCVECVQSEQCSAEKPTCDTGTHACRQCAVDADCASDVCDAEVGTCVAEANVLYVSPSGPTSGTCPKGTPCSLVQAVALADATRKNIKLAAGTYTSTDIMLSNKTLEIFGVGATINAQATSPAFEVDDNGHLRISGATVTATSTNGVIRCEGNATATHVLDLFRVTIVNSSSTLLANPCTLTVKESVVRNTGTAYHLLIVAPSVATFDRTQFIGAGGKGLAGLSGATIKITNSLFSKVGDLATSDRGVFNGSTFTVDFSTIVDSIVQCGTTGTTGLTLNSSIVRTTVAGAGDALQGITDCASAKYNVVFPSNAPLGATNLIADPQFVNIVTGDYHPLVTSPALDHGDPTSTLDVDFDGTPRPQGAQRDSGAFEYKP